jgi:hypothetical protein
MDVQTAIDIISRQSGLGRRQQAHTNAFYGINHRGVGNNIPHNTDNYGITFFTRPRMNLTYDNLVADRTMTTLLATYAKGETMQRAIRAILDPILAGKPEPSGQLADPVAADDPTKNVNLIDNQLPFIAILTNHLQSLSSWPDPTVDTFTSHEGINKEAWSMVDGQVRIFTTFDMTATFRNVAGDPISFLFNTWIKYASNVYTGKMVPYPDMILQNEIDYQTRIYRFVLDPSRQYITKVAACGAAFPYAVSLGAAFNYNSDQPFVADNAQEISVGFRCIGADYMDPITLREFNMVVQNFNPTMADGVRETSYIKLTPFEANYHNNYGYPRANESTFELEWWVDPADYIPVSASVLGVAAVAGSTLSVDAPSTPLPTSQSGLGQPQVTGNNALGSFANTQTGSPNMDPSQLVAKTPPAQTTGGYTTPAPGNVGPPSSSGSGGG